MSSSQQIRVGYLTRGITTTHTDSLSIHEEIPLTDRSLGIRERPDRLVLFPDSRNKEHEDRVQFQSTHDHQEGEKQLRGWLELPVVIGGTNITVARPNIPESCKHC